MTLAALLVGLLVVVQGLVGLAAPAAFAELVRWFQAPPVIYFAAVLRVVFGVVLVRAAPVSRAPAFLRAVGGLIVIGGALTPLIGVRFAEVVLGWWAEGGSTLVRAWAGAAFLLGAAIVYSTAPRRHAA